MRVDIEFLDRLVRRAAAEEVMPRFRKLRPEAIRTKSSPLDLVTDADEAAEALITAELRARFPGALVVGEEACAADPGLLDGIGEAELAFVVDPVDGTANFAAGLPLFGVMVGVISRGEVIAGVIHDPVVDDSALAVRGEGAWRVDRDGARERLQVATPRPLKQMSGGLSWRFFPLPERQKIITAAASLGGSFDFRCAAHQYRMLAAGSCHFMLFHRLLPWDHAAGWLLHHEAGGYAAMLDGRPYRPACRNGGYLCAPDRETWLALCEVLGLS